MPAAPHRRFLVPALLAVPGLFASPVSTSAENPGAHQHGHAELQMAYAGQTVELRALSPAYNLLGFEHEPRTEADHKTVEGALLWLKTTALINTTGKSCTLQSSEVDYAYAEGHHDEHGHEDHHHAEHDEDTHSNIEVIQTLTCPAINARVPLISQVSERFPALEHLDVQWSGPEGQGALRLESGETRFRLTR